MPREPTAGPDHGPEPPFPIQTRGRIVKGFGRGSRELGIPTANIPISGLDVGGHTDIKTGVYFGWAGLSTATSSVDSSEPFKHNSENVPEASPHSSKSLHATTDLQHNMVSELSGIYPMVMSIGWNPYYKNEVRSVEVHIMHQFMEDFYNAMMNLSILGFIRSEKDYISKEALIEDIKLDIDVARTSLERPPYAALAKDPYLMDFSWDVDIDVTDH